MVKSKLYLPLFVALFIVCFSISVAQSVYSGLGIGEVRSVPNARSLGMGGAGIAFRDSFQLSITNPALPASVNRTTIAISGSYHWILAEDNTTSDPRDYANFDGLAVAIPIYQTWTLSAGIDPFTIAQTKWYWKRQFDSDTYEEQYQVSGGISRSLIGISFSPRKNLLLGVGTRILFGAIDQTFTLNFVSSLYRDAQYVNRLSSMSVGATGGAVWDFYRGWSIGAFYYAKQQGDGSVEFSYLDSDSIRSTDGTIDFPASLGVGFSGYLKPRIRVAGDAEWTNWKDSQVIVGTQLPVTNTYRISAGFEYQPLFGEMEAFYNRFYYRLGFNTENNYIENLSGKSPRTSIVTAGLGIPLNEPDRRLDVALYWGIRGNIADFGVKETLFGISLTLVTSEKWFVRRK
jgi:long-subunit fatty acid transport protein